MSYFFDPEKMKAALAAHEAKKSPAQKARAQQELRALKSFGPQQVPEHRPASTNPSGSDLHEGDEYGVEFTDSQGVSHHDADDLNWVRDPTPGSTAVKGDPVDDAHNSGIHSALDQAQFEHADALRQINDSPHFTPSQKADARDRQLKKHEAKCRELTDAFKAERARKSIATTPGATMLEGVTALLHGETVGRQRGRPTPGQRSTRSAPK